MCASVFPAPASRASETGTPHVHGPEILDVRRRYRTPEWLRDTMKRGSGAGALCSWWVFWKEYICIAVM